MSEFSRLNFNIENMEKEVHIPEGTTKIEHKLFMDNDIIEKVVFPSTLESFHHSGAFWNCKNLKEIT